jgi:hypothetical protein
MNLTLCLSLAAIAGCGDDAQPGPHDLSTGMEASVPDLATFDSARSDSGGADSGAVDFALNADLDGCTFCGGQCIYLDRDPLNCGACGHACGCGVTSCTSGLCDPVTLASSQGGPVILALDGTTLYWGADVDRTLSRVSTSGGAATVVYPNRTQVRGIAFTALDVFFSRFVFNIIEGGPKAGGGGSNYTNTQESGAAGIGTDATNVYWATYNTGLIRSAPIGTPPQAPTTLTTGQLNAYALVVDAQNIYWITNNATGTVMQMAKAGGTPTTLAGNQATPLGLAVDANNVYWTNAGDGTVNSVPIGGTTITPIATGRKYPYNVAVDGSYVYWTDLSAGTIEKAPIGGTTITTVAGNQNQPLGLALDASCIYFTSYGAGAAGAGAVLKTSK